MIRGEKVCDNATFSEKIGILYSFLCFDISGPKT